MRFTSRSIIFLFILCTLAVFFFGFNAGKYITNVKAPILKVSITPTPFEKDSENIHYSFIRKSVPDCGVSFLLPDKLEEITRASQEAEFRGEMEHVFVKCKNESVKHIQAQLTEKSSSSSAVIAGQKAQAFASDEAAIVLLVNKKKQNVLIEVSRTLEDLIKDTLKLE